MLQELTVNNLFRSGHIGYFNSRQKKRGQKGSVGIANARVPLLLRDFCIDSEKFSELQLLLHLESN